MLKKYWLALPAIGVLWLWVLSVFFNLGELLLNYGTFVFLGVMGAIFANSTGAGGGVVFIPAFNSLSFSDLQAVHTSFAIQCFGMTAGSLAWWRYRTTSMTLLPDWQLLNRLVILTAPASMLGMACVFFLGVNAPASVHRVFSVFSVMLALALFATLMMKPTNKPAALNRFDYGVLALCSALGGVVTAWLSVGVGEFIAVYLILRRVDVRVAVACAVMVSALSVWFAAFAVAGFGESAVYWQVVVFAGPGALLGGLLARRLATWISPLILKRFFALWILIVGVIGLVE